MQVIVDDAVAAYEANEFWDSFEAGYDRLAADPERWADVEGERAAEAATLVDDLDRS